MTNVLLSIIPLLVFLVIYIPILAISIYCMVLFIKVAKRGIQALDIYIRKNENQNHTQF